MPQLMCQRPEADQVAFDNEDQRFVVCKASGVRAGDRVYAMGEELPRGVLNARALRQIYDSPLRLIETFEFALSDEQLMAAMVTVMPEGDEPEDDDEEKDAPPLAAPVVAGDGAPHVVRPHKSKKRQQ